MGIYDTWSLALLDGQSFFLWVGSAPGESYRLLWDEWKRGSIVPVNSNTLFKCSFHCCSCQSLEGFDLLVLDMIVSKVDLVEGIRETLAFFGYKQ